MDKMRVWHPLAIQTIECMTQCFCPVTCRTVRWNMAKTVVLKYEYSLRELAPILSLILSYPLSVLTDWHPSKQFSHISEVV